MDQKTYEEKEYDYTSLFAALKDLLERFKDYTPERAAELKEITDKAKEHSQDIQNGPEMFELVRQYIMYRNIELSEAKKRREQSEEKLFNDLPMIFKKLAVPNEDSCRLLADIVEEYTPNNNYQALAELLIKSIAEL